jgi:hypothetical protein
MLRCPRNANASQHRSEAQIQSGGMINERDVAIRAYGLKSHLTENRSWPKTDGRARRGCQEMPLRNSRESGVASGGMPKTAIE